MGNQTRGCLGECRDAPVANRAGYEAFDNGSDFPQLADREECGRYKEEEEALARQEALRSNRTSLTYRTSQLTTEQQEYLSTPSAGAQGRGIPTHGNMGSAPFEPNFNGFNAPQGSRGSGRYLQ